MIVTGEGRFTSDIFAEVEDAFSGETLTRRFQLGCQCLFRTSGTDPDQGDKLYIYKHDFVASTPHEIDLLSLVGPTIRWLHGKIGPADPAATLKLGGAAVNPWTQIGDLTLRPGTTLNHGCLVLSAPGIGYPVTAASKVLKFLPSAHAFSFTLYIVGSTV